MDCISGFHIYYDLLYGYKPEIATDTWLLRISVITSRNSFCKESVILVTNKSKEIIFIIYLTRKFSNESMTHQFANLLAFHIKTLTSVLIFFFLTFLEGMFYRKNILASYLKMKLFSMRFVL